ncbi:MAG: glycosyltransferase, partial [Anaerolineae bacterium]
REERTGFKAGALQAALAQTKGDIVVLFDADFVPPRDYLRRVVPFFTADPDLGCVQTRWEHLNRDYSLLTRAQALALDGHFAVEQVARNRAGLFMSFNGTAGAWRRACIEDSGGWQGDTLCEDLDLSYRAQLRGWQFLFLPEVAAPAELPAQVTAFKRQQFRWAKGSVQVLLKLGGAVLRAQRPWWVRLGGLLHLSGYLVHPLMLAFLLLSLPLFLWKGRLPLPFAFLGLASVGPPLLYALGQWTLRPVPRLWWQGYRALPALMALGVGIAWNNTVAVLEALWGRPTPFRRTPKFNLAGRAGDWRGSRYALRPGWTSLVEACLGFYALGVVWAALRAGNWLAVPFFALYAWGFFYVSLADLLRSHAGRKAGPRLTLSLPSAPSLPARKVG